MIKQAKFTCSHLGKVLQKQTKANEDQGKKQMKDHGKQQIEPNELIKNDFNIDKDSIPHEEKKIYLMNLLDKILLKFII